MSASYTSYTFTTGQTANVYPAEAPRETTALESHLHELMKLNDSLGSAVTRGERSADRLLGPQPSPIGKDGSKDAAAEPCLLRRLELALIQAHVLAEGVHKQLERFERL